MKRARLFLISLILIVSGCLSRAPEYPSDLSNVVVTMRRTACFGTCPVYSVTIYGDGRVVYEGERFVDVIGKQTATISQEQVKALVDEFYRIGFFALKDRYEEPVTDLPSTTTSITIDGTTKSVYDYYGAPEKLIQLEDVIDQVANTRQWIDRSSP